MFLRAFTVVAATLFATHAFGWNDRGHMMVAAIAWDNLIEETQERVTELLKLNPEYRHWVSGIPRTDRDKVAFMKAATWPDFIKRADGYINDGEDPTDATKAPAPAQNIGYQDKFQHRYWHYIDLPFSPDRTTLVQPLSPNAQTQIETFRDVLASNSGDELKSYDLVWLLHLVGDVHQPLHATSRFLQSMLKGDRGGNSVLLCAAPCKNELHAFWDGALGNGSSPRAVIRAADDLDEAPIVPVSVTEVRKWIEESFEIAKASVYVRPIGASAGPFTITQKYKDTAREIAEERVALGGARLAKLLNDHLR